MGNVYAMLVSGIVIAFVLCSLGLLASCKLIPSDVPRKLMHTSAGLLYMLLWPLYDDSSSSRWLASGIIALTTSYFAAVGLGFVKDRFLTAAATRTGRPKDLLKGPMLYGWVHAVLAALYWRDSPTGLVALCSLCGGDGMAVFGGMLGHKLGSLGRATLPWNQRKTWAGTLACFLGSFASSVPLLTMFVNKGYFHLEADNILQGCAICSAVCAVVESLPVIEYDNLTVPAAVALLASRGGVFKCTN